MSYKAKSALYFSSLVLAVIAYYQVGQMQANELVLKKETAKIENQIIVIPNTTNLNNL